MVNLKYNVNKTAMETCETFTDDDEVVHETDVYLSKAFCENLYLFHYPTRSNTAITDDTSSCLSARIKPKQQKIELEFGIDVHSHNYDTNRGEQIAYDVDAHNTTGEPFFNSGKMDKSLLSGTKLPNSSNNYALGFMKKGELHLTPLHSIIEIRPEFVHIDKSDNASRKALNPEEEEAEEQEAVAVTVRFEGPNAEKSRQMRQKSYQYFQQKNASEPWVNLRYHKLGSNRSLSEREKVLCAQVHEDASSEEILKEDYLKELVPECLRLSGCQSSRDDETAIPSDKPLSDQMKQLMINAHLLTFPMLVEKLACNADTVSIERLIQQIAVLVQGCWAIKSELLYDENTVSPFSGVSAKQLVNARDYILWLFTKKTFLTRTEILSVTHVPDEDFRAMMNPLAVKTNRGWEFKFPVDEEFLVNHPDIQKSQDIKWVHRYNKLLKDLKMSECEVGESSKASCAAASRPRQKRHSRSSISEGDESGTDSSTCATKDKIKRSYVPKKRSALSPSKAGSKSKPFPIATLDISPTYLETSLSESVKSELRDYVGDAVRQQFCMTLKEIKEFVLESNLSSIANRSDFETVLDEVLNDYGAQKLKNKWPQNTAPEILYAFAKFGNKLDRYRVALLDLFSTTARTRANLFVKKVEDELRERVSETDCRQIFEEYCVYKSGFYYLKGTIPLEP